MQLARQTWLGAAGVACIASVAIHGNAAAQSPAEFYKGRNVNLVIGYSAGGGFDAYARMLARHLGKHVPGNPTIVAQNMPGAASLKAVEHMVQIAARDGTSIATFSHTMPVQPLLGGAKFDPNTFEWLGSITSETSVCISWQRSSVKSWEDLAKGGFTAGGTGKGSDQDMFVALLQSVFKLPIKLVSGYPGTNDIMLAAERGEVDGLCGLSYSTITSRYNELLEKKQINILVQAAAEKDPALPNVPFLLDLAKEPRQKQMLDLVVAAQMMARPFAMPAGTPKDRADAMRAAFKSTMEDSDFLAEAKKARAEVKPVYPEQIRAFLKRVYATPPDIVQETVKALQ